MNFCFVWVSEYPKNSSGVTLSTCIMTVTEPLTRRIILFQSISLHIESETRLKKVLVVFIDD